MLLARTRARVMTRGTLVVAAASGLPGVAPLAAAPAEVQAIRTRMSGPVAELSGPSATPSNLISRGLEQYAVLHFASHAVPDEDRPLRSALLLAPDAAHADGRWTAEDIYRRTLRAQLVVLSACSTASGAETAGEGVMSLARAFLYAGADTAIATLWDVPDAPGPAFADALYRGLAAGRPIGEATANARRALRRSGAPPRAWAAYVLTGDPSRSVASTAPVSDIPRALRAAGGLFAVALVVTLLRRRVA